MIEYRQATLKDKPRVLNFYKKAYPDDFEIRSSAQWDWQYEHNPNTSDKIGIWLAIDTESRNIVGHTAVIFEKFKMGPNYILMGWGIDLVVLPEFRGRKIAFGLQKCMMNKLDVYMNISMAYSTRLISNKLGSIETSAAVQFVKPLFVPSKRINHLFLLQTHKNHNLINKIKRRFLKQVWFKTIMYYLGIDYLYSVSYKKKCQFKNAIQSSKFTFKLLRQNESLKVIDVLWDKLSKHYDKITIRNSIYFKWKYTDQPHKTHHCYIVYEQIDPVGYIVIRDGGLNEPNVGIIVDYLCSPDRMDVFVALLNFAELQFKADKKEFIYVISSDIRLSGTLNQMGYKKTRKHVPTFLTSKQELKNNLISNPDKWFLTLTDHELDRYPVKGK